ncbi:head-to-tail adaptor [Mycobacterium phage Gaia]|uniref:Head-to-tail adaptor n=1 Tax=Mycobacterium phage Gaia TaxID=1486472 RepID=A0A068F4G2_9CAUD|nr:head-tail adaptor [Mycobacterium phage Gaia]AID58826.1 head-to-tail adaptor [Mycobacterium phage Gaia]AYQ99948.1 head-to-tail adaptor [Mycobacterium phage Nebkiss]
MALLEVDDLLPFAPNLDEAKGEAMVADALALAARIAPCILEDDFAYEAAAKAVLRGAVLRWVDQGSSTQPALQAGIFSMTPQNQPRKAMFYPSEITELQALCGGGRGRAFMIDTTPQCEDQ